MVPCGARASPFAMPSPVTYLCAAPVSGLTRIKPLIGFRSPVVPFCSESPVPMMIEPSWANTIAPGAGMGASGFGGSPKRSIRISMLVLWSL